MRPARVILHLDMDAFYAAVETREDPGLAGQPLIIGHRGQRGVVSTCSYEARRFGVHSAMPSVVADRKCPDAIWLPGRMQLYTEVSREIRRILDDYSPRIEPLSIDEAFVDLTGIVRDLDGGVELARDIQKRIDREQRLGASIGVSPNKFLAKVASDMDKPRGLVKLCPDNLAERFWPLPIERLWGVGPRTASRMHAGGLRTIGDILKVSEPDLGLLVGPTTAAHLLALARGVDPRPVVSTRRAKSISEERTYGRDLRGLDRIDRALLERAAGVSRQLRRQGLVGRTVQIKVRTADYSTWTRATTLAEPTDLTEPIVLAARQLFRSRLELEGRGLRLLGVGISGLTEYGHGQPALFDDPRQSRARRLERAADTLRDRLGDHAVTRARLLRPSSASDPDDSDDPYDDDEASSLPTVD